MKKREWLFVCISSAVISLVELKLKIDYTPAWNNGTLLRNHALLLEFQYTNNEQSRLLQFSVPEFFHRHFGIPVVAAYGLQRWLFVAAALVCFYSYLRKWFDSLGSLAGVFFLSAMLPLTFWHVNDLQESSPLLLLTFTLSLWAIREGKQFAFLMILWMGALNNETILFLAAVFFAVNVTKHTALKTAANTALLCGPAYLSQATIRYLTRDRPHLGGAFHLRDNFSGIVHALAVPCFHWDQAPYIFFILLFGAVWVFAYFDWPEKPHFLRRAGICVPLFIIPHLITGKLDECRQMVPLAGILIPLAWYSLTPRSDSNVTV